VGYLFLASAGAAGGAFGASPMTDFNGHTEKAGHFWQPATIAIGHSVMVGLLNRSAAYAQGNDRSRAFG
jgi:hypothetical protein